MVIVASEGQILMTLRRAVFLLRLLKALLASTRSTASDSWSLNIVRSAWTAASQPASCPTHSCRGPTALCMASRTEYEA